MDWRSEDLADLSRRSAEARAEAQQLISNSQTLLSATQAQLRGLRGGGETSTAMAMTPLQSEASSLAGGV